MINKIILRNTFFALFLFISFKPDTIAQTLSKTDFKNEVWFVNNENNNFYKSDTIKLLKILKLNNENEKLNKTSIKLDKNKNRDITELHFRKNGKLVIGNLSVKNWDVSKLVGKWKWKFCSEKQTLNLYYNTKLKFSFLFISKNQESISRIYKGMESKISFSTIYLRRINI